MALVESGRELWDEVAAEVPRGSMGFHKCTTDELYILDMSRVAPAAHRNCRNVDALAKGMQWEEVE